ncbi:aspartate ammonia-lyase [Actinomycetaceae bacterium L2_0104]
MTTVRIETDLLGNREVPADAYYGIHTLRAVENFPISGKVVSDVPEFVRGMVLVKKAEALANNDAHVLDPVVADAIVKACDEVLVKGRCMDQWPVDLFQGGAGTSVNMNTNEVIANLALEVLGREKGDYAVVNPNDDVNKSQSTNDAYPTGLHLAVYDVVEQLAVEAENLAASFRTLAADHTETLKMGRTQLQDAVPMSVGQEFNAFATVIEYEVADMRRVAQELLDVNLGATAIGTGLNTPDGFPDLVVNRLAEVTGLPICGDEDLLQGTYDNGVFVSVHSSIKRLAVNLSKICNDLRLLSSGPRAGLKEINLPEMQAGSSIMPAKVNPVIPEVVNQVCFKVIGNDTAVSFAAEAGQLQLNVMEPVTAQCLFESPKLLENACRTLRERCVEGITVNEERCHEYVMNSIGIITYLNDIIGHHNGDLVGKECAATGKSVREVVLELGLVTEEQLDKAFSAQNLLHPKYMGKIYADLPESE